MQKPLQLSYIHNTYTELRQAYNWQKISWNKICRTESLKYAQNNRHTWQILSLAGMIIRLHTEGITSGLLNSIHHSNHHENAHRSLLFATNLASENEDFLSFRSFLIVKSAHPMWAKPMYVSESGRGWGIICHYIFMKWKK